MGRDAPLRRAGASIAAGQNRRLLRRGAQLARAAAAWLAGARGSRRRRWPAPCRRSARAACAPGVGMRTSAGTGFSDGLAAVGLDYDDRARRRGRGTTSSADVERDGRRHPVDAPRASAPASPLPLGAAERIKISAPAAAATPMTKNKHRLRSVQVILRLRE